MLLQVLNLSHGLREYSNTNMIEPNASCLRNSSIFTQALALQVLVTPLEI